MKHSCGGSSICQMQPGHTKQKGNLVLRSCGNWVVAGAPEGRSWVCSSLVQTGLCLSERELASFRKLQTAAMGSGVQTRNCGYRFATGWASCSPRKQIPCAFVQTLSKGWGVPLAGNNGNPHAQATQWPSKRCSLCLLISSSGVRRNP